MLKKYIPKLLLSSASAVVALIGAEVLLRYQVTHNTENPFAHNPIIAAQMTEGTFFPDPQLGHRLVPPFAYSNGQHYDSEKTKVARGENKILPSSFISGEVRDIQTIDEVVVRVKERQSTNPVVLNIGDSSTSGWDSDQVTRNKLYKSVARESYIPLSPFFQYKTYSDILAAENMTVINAGVPGYTSYQGKYYVKRLLDEFHERGVSIDYITIYFGNNESVWNGNIEDKYVLPSEDNLKLIGAIKRWQSAFLYPRVSAEEYEENIKEIIEACQEYGVQPILIEPVIPKYWYPGMRAKGEEAAVWQVMYENKGDEAIDKLNEAIHLYEEGVRMYQRAGSEDQREQAKELFIAAQNQDYLVPRIKPVYVAALHRIATETKTPLVDIQGQIPLDDHPYFIDYCHPIEPANKLIAEGIAHEITYR